MRIETVLIGVTIILLWFILSAVENAVGFLREIRDELQRLQSDVEAIEKKA
jgi:hypothetical protein